MCGGNGEQHQIKPLILHHRIFTAVTFVFINSFSISKTLQKHLKPIVLVDLS